MRRAVERLHREHTGRLNAETIEGFMSDSLATQIHRAGTGDWVHSWPRVPPGTDYAAWSASRATP